MSVRTSVHTSIYPVSGATLHKCLRGVRKRNEIYKIVVLVVLNYSADIDTKATHSSIRPSVCPLHQTCERKTTLSFSKTKCLHISIEIEIKSMSSHRNAPEANRIRFDSGVSAEGTRLIQRNLNVIKPRMTNEEIVNVSC